MEATSARFASGRDRDRYSGWAEPATTPLQRYIQNACDPQNFEPNLALDLEIADLINAKKGAAPREAAMAVVGHVNNRNPNVSMHALTLLDICVKNCGYPFHLQISTKEFLNELVRRFPERPPVRYSRVQAKILELIEEWRQTICQTSKYKDDLGFIRDMHRLLSYKGYTFPAVKREDAAVLNPSEALRSAEEMEEEEKAAQSAKLQELIRRGTPHDLQEANRLMKVMAGYDVRHKTDYRAKAAEEVGKVQQKAKILEEMLQQYKPGDDSINSETWEDLGNALASAQPKIQKMCEEESDDTEAVAKLLEINDSLHRTLERYRLTKRGDLEGAANIPKGTLGTSGAGVRHGADNELSLIDFGGDELTLSNPSADLVESEQPKSSAPAPSGASFEDDLLGLSIQDSSSHGPSVSLSSAFSGASMMSTQQTGVPSQFSMPAMASSANSVQPPKANYDPFGSMGLSQPTAQMGAASAVPQRQGHAPHGSESLIDPFAALSGSTSRTASPFRFQQSVHPTSSSSAGLPGSSRPQQATAAQPSTPQQNGFAGEDEWTFSSSLPDQPHEITVTNTSINVAFLVSRSPQSTSVILINSSISNNTPQLITDLTFQIAVTKGYSLKLEPQSGRHLQPLQKGGITQAIQLQGVEPGKGQSVKVRWKTSYTLAGSRRDEQGEVSSLGVA